MVHNLEFLSALCAELALRLLWQRKCLQKHKEIKFSKNLTHIFWMKVKKTLVLNKDVGYEKLEIGTIFVRKKAGVR